MALDWISNLRVLSTEHTTAKDSDHLLNGFVAIKVWRIVLLIIIKFATAPANVYISRQQTKTLCLLLSVGII
jgi:hypothetical protein